MQKYLQEYLAIRRKLEICALFAQCSPNYLIKKIVPNNWMVFASTKPLLKRKKQFIAQTIDKS